MSAQFRWFAILTVIVGALGGCGPTAMVRDDVPVVVDDPMDDPADDFDEVLLVDIGADVLLAAPAVIDLSASVSGAHPEGSLLYSWSYGTADEPVLEESAFALDENTTTIDPEELFDAETLAAGVTLTVTVRVREVRENVAQEAHDDLLVIIDRADPPPTDIDSPPADGGEDDVVDPPADDDDPDTAPDGGAENDDPLPPDGGGGNNVVAGDPCAGSTVFTLLGVGEQHMSLFEGTRTLQPIICNGVPPLTYEWTPIELLQDGGGALDGPSGLVDTPSVDFQPTAAGDYRVSLKVTDAEANDRVASFFIHVYGFDPLIVSASGDQVVDVGAPLVITASATGGSGQYDYLWEPGAVTSAALIVPTAELGQFAYTVRVTDTLTGTSKTASTAVVVTAADAGGCVDRDVTTGLDTARFVEFDGGFGAAGQAVVASGVRVALIDLSDDSIRATLTLPSDATGMAVDVLRRRAFVSTRLPAAFTRSVQVIDLDAATAGANIGLVDTVAAARGLAVIPSTGHVLVAVSGAADGLIEVNPDTAMVAASVLNLHHDASFFQPIDVAVVDNGAIASAVVANASSPQVTVVPLTAIVFDPLVAPPGGVNPPLPTIAIAGAGRGIVADGDSGRLAVAINDGNRSQIQIVQLTDTVSGAAGTSTQISEGISDLAIDGDGQGRVVVATAAGTAVVVLLDFNIVANTIDTGIPALDVAFANGDILAVGTGSTLGVRCP